MKTNVEEAMEKLAKKSSKTETGVEAMQFSQAVLNLAHTLQVLKQTDKT